MHIQSRLLRFYFRSLVHAGALIYLPSRVSWRVLQSVVLVMMHFDNFRDDENKQ